MLIEKVEFKEKYDAPSDHKTTMNTIAYKNIPANQAGEFLRIGAGLHQVFSEDPFGLLNHMLNNYPVVVLRGLLNGYLEEVEKQ